MLGDGAHRQLFGRAYNRTTFLEERRMMVLWADYLDGLRDGAAVFSIERATSA